MKKHFKRFIAMLVVAVLVFVGSFGVVAAKYKSKLVSDDFSSAANSKFHCAGDVNGDGSINTTDAQLLAKQILGVTSSTDYPDANGDSKVDILDLVRVENNDAGNYFVTGGQMGFNGKNVYTVPFDSSVNTGAKYQISYKYKASAQVTIGFNLAGTHVAYQHPAQDNWQTVSNYVTTEFSKSASEQAYDIIINGKGYIKDFSITRVDMDNVTSAPQ